MMLKNRLIGQEAVVVPLVCPAAASRMGGFRRVWEKERMVENQVKKNCLEAYL